jgi:ABC-type sugar transport system permease subunit
MQTISQQLYEMAEIDGASAIRKFFHVTLAELKIIMLLVTSMSVIWTFNEFPWFG